MALFDSFYFPLIIIGLTGVMALKWRGAHYQWLELVKSLFPSWRFFDQLGHVLEIEIQWEGAPHFEPFFSPLKPSLCQVIYNPKGNLRQALLSGLTHFARDPENPNWQHWLLRLVESESPKNKSIAAIQVILIHQQTWQRELIYRYEYSH